MKAKKFKLFPMPLLAQPETNPIERALGALLAFHNRHAAATETIETVEEEQEEGKLNIFCKVTLDDTVKAIVGASQSDQFSSPLILRKCCER